MKRKRTGSSADVWARLTSRDYVAMAPDRLRWTRPTPGAQVIVRDEQVSLPKKTVVEQMTWAQWAEALNDFAAVQYIGAEYPALTKRGDTPANVPRGFAQKYGLLQTGPTMRDDFFLEQQRTLREFDRAVRLERQNLDTAVAHLEAVKPPIGVGVALEAHRSGNRLVLVPRDLLSGLWLVAIRAATFDAAPLRICALVGCDAPLEGTARNAFCCAEHRATAWKNNHAKDKRRLRDQLNRVPSAVLEGFTALARGAA